jgi:hypothetical protein
MTPSIGEDLRIGKSAVTNVMSTCCGKPQGCSRISGCLYATHPYKLEHGIDVGPADPAREAEAAAFCERNGA